MLLSNLTLTSLVYFIVLLSPNLVITYGLTAIIFTLFVVFSGFLITRDNIPGWWIWLHYMDILMYPFESLLINEFSGLALSCEGIEFVGVPITSVPGSPVLPFCPFTTGPQFLASFGLDTKWFARDPLVLLGWWILLLVLNTLLIKFVVHQKR